MALTKASFGPQSQPNNPRATSDAASVYSGNDATRMHREAGISAVAATYTDASGTAQNSYADGSFNLGEAKPTPGKAQRGNVAQIPGHGFPGNEPSLG